ncbi:hypothetical protein [Lacticaseibacillus mingshuiensis]|uniref:Uncharacterized protein n=1 Tax=Lacticaseibacillus mingshuiensis TaxID=2799574 RepID=A0ABW4CGP7_9LACO|nr:hypothetical protein [Lacticaseibacillus mingshuiensis]
MALLEWVLGHELTIAALLLTALAAYAIGKYDQQFLDDKKAAKRDNA